MMNTAKVLGAEGTPAMTPIRSALLLAGLLALAPAAQAQKDGTSLGMTPGGSSRVDGAGTTRYADPSGRSTGSSRQDGAGTTRYYDQGGRPTGSSRPSGNGRTDTLYDPAGRQSGSRDTDTAGTTTTRDARGAITGSSRVDGSGRTIYYDAQGRMITR